MTRAFDRPAPVRAASEEQGAGHPGSSSTGGGSASGGSGPSIPALTLPRSSATAFRAEVPRRATDLPGMPPRNPPAPSRLSEANQLVVGREIALSGQISACEKLVVEGQVEAALGDCRIIEIKDTGIFKGTADIENAEIGGLFEGKLVVRGVLTVRGTGRVIGEVLCRELEVQRGGRIVGKIDFLDDKGQPGK